MRLKFLLLFIFLLLVFSLLLVRLVDVEIVKGQHFFDLAESNRYFTKKNPAERAIFLDRYDQPLVRNEKQYFKYLQKDKLYSEKEFLPKDEALSLLATDSAKIGYEFNRVYPYKEALSSVLGYLSPVTAEDLDKNPSLAISSRLGRMGLEQFFDKSLQSKGSVMKFEINALGQTKRLVSTIEQVYGQNIKTTLDSYLSLLAYQAMGEKRGAVVIMDASNGELLTLISTPSFDNNIFEENYLNNLFKRDIKDSSTKISNYFKDERQIFFNRSTSGAYPPGSVFKLVTALAALQEGVIKEDTVVDDQGTLEVGGSEFANWYFTQYGRVEGAIEVKRALARSNDIFFYKAAEWLGPTKLAEYARMFGFGSLTGVQTSQEVEGLVPDPKWKETQRGESWYLGNTYHFGIGQGDLLVTPIQVANMTQAIANNGSLCKASFLEALQQNCRDLAIDAKNLEIVLSGMVGACSQGGTAYPLFPFNTKYPGMIACKTGTAEFGAADERGYRKTHAWTTAIVNIDQAKIVNEIAVANATESGELKADSTKDLTENLSDGSIQSEKKKWQEATHKYGFPDKIVITVLVESDAQKIYSEGSQDAAPVIKQILEGMM